jgi:hypothetical protein
MENQTAHQWIKTPAPNAEVIRARVEEIHVKEVNELCATIAARIAENPSYEYRMEFPCEINDRELADIRDWLGNHWDVTRKTVQFSQYDIGRRCDLIIKLT